MNGIELGRLWHVDRIRAHEFEDAAELRRMERDARRFLTSHCWVRGVRDGWLGFGIGGVVAVFLYRLFPVEGVDEWLWVVVGDMPSAYLVTDAARTPAEALERYAELMDDWVEAVRAGTDLGLVFPVAAAPEPELADQLARRMEFLRTTVVPEARARFASRLGTEHAESRSASDDSAGASAVRPGDLIVDNLGRECIVQREVDCPDEDWLGIQNDERMREHRDSRWWTATPSDGGSVCIPEPLLRVLRPATVDDAVRYVRQEPYSWFALSRVFPTLPERVPEPEL